MYREVLAGSKLVLGPEHPRTLATVFNLENSLRGQKRHAEAEAMLRDVLAVQKRVLGPEHPDTLSATSIYAVSLLGHSKYAPPPAPPPGTTRKGVDLTSHLSLVKKPPPPPPPPSPPSNKPPPPPLLQLTWTRPRRSFTPP
jgi:hypothetical protein